MSGKLIKIRFLGGLSDQEKKVFKDVAADWNAVLKDSISLFPNVWTDIGLTKGIVIDAAGIRIDQEGGVLGQAGPTMIQEINGKKFPRRGVMQFDIADLNMMSREGTLYAVIRHEMGHVLGIGTLWDRFVSEDMKYSGPRAFAAYKEKLNGKESTIPVEDKGGPGTAGGHWKETVFDTELMTGYAEDGGIKMPLSVMSIGALEDLGYRVDYTKAEKYTIPSAPVPMRSVRMKKKHCRHPPYLNITNIQDLLEKEFIKRVNKTINRLPSITAHIKSPTGLEGKTAITQPSPVH
jgi:hypothetical protein